MNQLRHLFPEVDRVLDATAPRSSLRIPAPAGYDLAGVVYSITGDQYTVFVTGDAVVVDCDTLAEAQRLAPHLNADVEGRSVIILRSLEAA